MHIVMWIVLNVQLANIERPPFRSSNSLSIFKLIVTAFLMYSAKDCVHKSRSNENEGNSSQHTVRNRKKSGCFCHNDNVNGVTDSVHLHMLFVVVY